MYSIFSLLDMIMAVTSQEQITKTQIVINCITPTPQMPQRACNQPQ